MLYLLEPFDKVDLTKVGNVYIGKRGEDDISTNYKVRRLFNFYELCDKLLNYLREWYKNWF